MNEKDFDAFLYGEARSKCAMGVRPDDVIQIMTR